MRRSPVVLALLALVTSACASGTASSPGIAGDPPPAHHVPTAEPWWPEPEPEPEPEPAPERTLEPQPTEEPWWPEPAQPGATPYDGVTYDDPGVNPFIPAEEDGESTFALDVDTASYAI